MNIVSPALSAPIIPSSVDLAPRHEASAASILAAAALLLPHLERGTRIDAAILRGAMQAAFDGSDASATQIRRAALAHVLAPEPDIVCLGQQARLARDDRSVLAEAEKLWLTMLEPPEACRAVLDALIRENRVTTDDIWARVHRQFEANRTGPAKVTLAALPAGQAPDAKALDKIGRAHV